MQTIDKLCFMPATKLSGMLKSGQLGAVELLTAYLNNIDNINPTINAIITDCREQAYEQARAADNKKQLNLPRGLLHGLPIGVKDNLRTKGITTTYGSPSFKDYIPADDDLIVERQQAAGAILLGKTNLPEFSYGGQTTNRLFGATLNPYDFDKTCSGSSGGGAAAVACGMVALATGSDVAGSLRSPPAWCNVVGFRPTPGRIPRVLGGVNFDDINVHGPMARTAGDIALFMRAVSGPDDRSPLSLPNQDFDDSEIFNRQHKNVAIAWSMDLGYAQPDSEISKLFADAIKVFSGLGANLTETCPPVYGASKTLLTLKTEIMASELSELIEAGKEHELPSTLQKGLERASKLSVSDIADAHTFRSQLKHEVSSFMKQYEFLVWPTHLSRPYAVDDPIAEHAMDWTPVDVAPLLGLPAITVPCGFDNHGLPAGLQIMGQHGADADET
jgi:amidase